VVLADADQAAPARVSNGIGVAPIDGWRERLGDATGPLAVEALIAQVGKVDRAVQDGKGTAAVLMDAGAGVKGSWGHIAQAPVGRPAHDDVAAALRRPQLDPVDVLAVKGDLLQPDRPRDDQVGKDR